MAYGEFSSFCLRKTPIVVWETLVGMFQRQTPIWSYSIGAIVTHIFNSSKLFVHMSINSNSSSFVSKENNGNVIKKKTINNLW